MGRKSLKPERVKQILDAFEVCLEKKGLQSTSLDDVAKEAGIDRRVVRHYVGNREDLINQAVERIVQGFNTSVMSFIDQHSNEENRITVAIDYIFSEAFNELPATKHVAALFAEVLFDARIKAAVKSIYESFKAGIETEIARHYPNSDLSEREQVSFSIMSLAFGGGWMGNLGFDRGLNEHNRKMAYDLLEGLN